MSINPIVILIVLGLIAVLVIATVGAIASRKFKFRYSLLSLISLSLYIVIGYWAAKIVGLPAALVTSAVLGLFDSTVGWQLCLRYKANLTIDEEQELMEIPETVRILMMVMLAIVCGVVGYLLADN